MSGLIMLGIVVCFFYVCYGNVCFWADALLKRHVPELWFLPCIVLPFWIVITGLGIYAIVS